MDTPLSVLHYATYEVPEDFFPSQFRPSHLSIAAVGSSIVHIGFEENTLRELTSVYRFSRDEYAFIKDPDHPVLLSTRDRLQRFVRGDLRGSSSIDVAFPRATSFEQKVIAQLRSIPRGSTRTYGQIAKAIGNPRGCRAVAGACGRNPVALIVPCHRVVAANGIGGFRSGVQHKTALLELEKKDVDGDDVMVDDDG